MPWQWISSIINGMYSLLWLCLQSICQTRPSVVFRTEQCASRSWWIPGIPNNPSVLDFDWRSPTNYCTKFGTRIVNCRKFTDTCTCKKRRKTVLPQQITAKIFNRCRLEFKILNEHDNINFFDILYYEIWCESHCHLYMPY